MTEERAKRKLSAILCADVAGGYSCLMAEDEAETVKTLNTYKEIMSTLIKHHRGRVVDSTGYSLICKIIMLLLFILTPVFHDSMPYLPLTGPGTVLR
jgi:class 3 adenylate cyclase